MALKHDKESIMNEIFKLEQQLESENDESAIEAPCMNSESCQESLTK